ncbi:DR1-associated protein 1 (negative cofactor 2 alpha) [Dinochytrium kinnereticum]|nr:DR1-associated protein 1 (negative cofactor 2 alpha) [Dinochytrium kinnereticum]
MGRRKEKTRFPVARIKKIMRTDDDVGKVAQVTPVLISKALELFMQAIVDETCKFTRAKCAKKMSASHLKMCILQTPKFDFLKDLVQNIPDPLEGAAGGGDDEDVIKEGDSESGRGKGRGKGRGAKASGSTRGRRKRNSAGGDGDGEAPTPTDVKGEGDGGF